MMDTFLILHLLILIIILANILRQALAYQQSVHLELPVQTPMIAFLHLIQGEYDVVMKKEEKTFLAISLEILLDKSFQPFAHPGLLSRGGGSHCHRAGP